MIELLVNECARHGAALFSADQCLVTRQTADGSVVLAAVNDATTNVALRNICADASALEQCQFDEINGVIAVPITHGTECLGAIGLLLQNAPRPTITLAQKQLASLASVVAEIIWHVHSVGASLHEQALDVLGQAVVVTDLDDTVLWANGATHQMFELASNRSLTGLSLHEVADLSRLSNARHIRERIAPYVDPHQTAIAGTIRFFDDETAQEQERLRLESLVNTEWLTGVASRRSFEAILQHEIEAGRGTNATTGLAVGLADLDKFKRVNDELGHAAGDQVLIDVAQHIRDEIPENATLARLGGDEFALLLRGTNLDDARHLGCQIAASLAKTMSAHNDARSGVSASFGFTMVRSSDRVSGDCLGRADEACYHAKERGGGTARAVA